MGLWDLRGGLQGNLRARARSFLFTLGLVAFNPWTSPAWAARFANQFVEFELPAQWQCRLEGAEWICQSVDEQKKKDAIIVMAAKLKGDQDSLDQYLVYLKEPKVFNNIQNQQITSEPKYARNTVINGHPWIDSLHTSSEIAGFNTRYLATVKQDIGVLVTYSINKDKYQTYLNDFESLVKTLRVFRKAGSINAGTQSLFQAGSVPANLADSTFPQAAPQGGADQRPAQQKPDDLMFWIIVAGIAVVAILIWKKKRQGG